jgi:hypothetical protein
MTLFTLSFEVFGHTYGVGANVDQTLVWHFFFTGGFVWAIPRVLKGRVASSYFTLGWIIGSEVWQMWAHHWNSDNMFGIFDILASLLGMLLAMEIDRRWRG